MKPKQRLKEMQASLYEIITGQTNYSWVNDQKDGAVIETQVGHMNIFLHYNRKGVGSLKHQIDASLFNMQNTSNLFYGDGENFLCSENNKLLANINYKGARNYLARKEQFMLEMQRRAKTKKEEIEFDTNLAVGRFPKLHSSDYLSYIIAQEFGGGIRTYAMRPVFQRYPRIMPEDPRYDFVKEGFAKTKFISQQVSPRANQFELVPVKQNGRLFVFAPKK